ncbi:MAG TPA: ferric reductase-like transmembrane domain-containing protein [Opitutaceae bacterium]|nr:ferric reductase-like transmembrane domain-containing protein [Opitutaceae bacterium]
MERLLRSKAFVICVIVLPGLWPAWPIMRRNPTVMADPGKYLLHHFGFVACILLATVLSFTPLRVLFPQSKLVQALNRHRRTVGVSTFVYAAIHLTFQFLHEDGWPTFWKDMRKPFLLAGMAIFLILLALAATSFNAAVRWLGGRRWKNLHRLAYLAAPLAAYHQAAARKLFPVQVLWIFVPLALLEAGRIAKNVWSRKNNAPAPPAAGT